LALALALALAGLVAARGQRAVIFRYRVAPPPLAVEAVTAFLLAGLAARVHPGLVLAAACWLALCAVPLAFIDAAVKRLPDPLTLPGYAGTVLLLLAAAAAGGGHWDSLTRALLGGVVLAGFYLILAFISPSGMGMGDVKAAASIGTLLAWPSWRLFIVGGSAAFLLAAVYGIALLVSGRASRKQHIPFGPFMLTGAFLAILAWHFLRRTSTTVRSARPYPWRSTECGLMLCCNT
jgi:leader peptidase (prepilin peptidase)/N-methyltransferase